MSARVILTYDDYAALPDDGRRYELYEGELVMTPSPLTRHQLVIGNLHMLMAEHVRRRGLGEVFLSPIDVILSRITVLQPDLVYVERAQLGIVTERAIEGAPTLVVEVLSPSTGDRDRGAKQALYTRSGVPCYWFADPAARTVEALGLAEGAYASTGASWGRPRRRCRRSTIWYSIRRSCGGSRRCWLSRSADPPAIELSSSECSAFSPAHCFLGGGFGRAVQPPSELLSPASLLP